MIIAVKSRWTGNVVANVNTELGESLKALIRKANPNFFQKLVSRKSEKFSYYKGCVIASYTADGTGWRERRHVPYVVDGETGEIFCIGSAKSPANAKRLIDETLAFAKIPERT